MKIVSSAGLGLAFAVSAFAFYGPSASAVEALAPISKPQASVVRVDEREREHCERVRRECRERHHEHEYEYKECVRREHCEP